MKKKTRALCILYATLFAMSMLAGCSGKAATAALPSVTGAIAQAPEDETYKVTLDVNPSIELTVTDGAVTGATAYNDDGQSIVLNTNVAGMTPDTAVRAIVRELAAGGYLDTAAGYEPYLIITVSKNGVTDQEKTNELKDCAEETIGDLKLECRIGTADVSAEDVTAAASLNISVGRYILLRYIAEKEGITIEQAVETYGSMKIGDLMDMFEGLDDLFKTEDNNGRGDFLAGLTDEQIQIVNGAIKAYKTDLKSAEKVFHDTWKQIKDKYTKQIRTVEKEKLDAAAIQAKLDELKQSMITERNAALAALNAAVNTAKDQCNAAVATVPVNQELFTKYLNNLAAKEIDKQEGFNEMLKLFRYHGKGNVSVTVSDQNGDSQDGKGAGKGNGKN